MSLIRSMLSFGKHALNNRTLSYSCRRFASSENVVVDHENDTGVVTLTLSQPPVNSLNGEFLTNISETMKKLESDSSVRGILITSKFHGRVFSSGLNILDMFQKSDAHLGEFWRCVQEWYLDVFGCSKPIVAAMNGHAPAGGCAMGLMCDYRIIAEGKTIGLNETQLGIAAPFFFVDLMTSAIGRRHSELALSCGTMFSSEEALKINLVDQVLSLDDVIPEAKKQILRFSKIPQPAFQITKNIMRGGNIKQLRDTREEDIANFVNLIQRPYVQAVIGKYLEHLKQKKK